MAAFICESIPEEGQTFEKVTLADSQSKLDSTESLGEFHKEEYPWAYDRETGDLYEYDDFEDALVPIKDFDTSSDSDVYNRYWMEFSSTFSKDGKKLKIRTVNKTKNVLLGESVQSTDIEVFDIEEKINVYNPGEDDEYTRKCMDVPTAGLDIQWADAKG